MFKGGRGLALESKIDGSEPSISDEEGAIGVNPIKSKDVKLNFGPSPSKGPQD